MFSQQQTKEIINQVEYTLSMDYDSTKDDYVYVDYIDNNAFRDGGSVICPCHPSNPPFYKRENFRSHCKSQKHKCWIKKLNSNKHNHHKYYIDTLRDLREQKIVNRKLDNEKTALELKLKEFEEKYEILENANIQLNRENTLWKDRCQMLEQRYLQLEEKQKSDKEIQISHNNYMNKRIEELTKELDKLTHKNKQSTIRIKKNK